MSPSKPERTWKQGRVQVYTGDGKGKTCAALGLALRAAGAGLHVFIAQFAKGMPCSELEALKCLAPRVSIQQYGRNSFIVGEPCEDDITAAKKGLEAVKEILASGRFEVVILDEANIATFFGLFSADDLLEAIAARAPHVEVIITGRRAHPRILAVADLITEMREIRHYHQNGVPARRGIEN